jgi:hypothetical protein
VEPQERLQLIAMLATDDAWEAVIKVGETLLDHYYPKHVFTGESGDSGPLYIVALREAFEALREALGAVERSGA